MIIWIINEYAGSPVHGMSYRHYYLAREWKLSGHEPVIITGSFSHFLKNLPAANRLFTKDTVDIIKYIWVKVMKYTNSHDKKRVIKWFEFSLKLLFLPILRMDKPDVILCSPTAPFSIVPSWILSRIYKAKLVFEVRDIWPLTLIELGGYKRKNLFIYFMALFEKFAIKKADIIVSNLPNYGKHVTDIGLRRKWFYLPNGVTLNSEVKPIEKEILEFFPKNKFIVGYAGTLGHANALEYLIEGLKLVKNDMIHVVIVGGGKNKNYLQEISREFKNITFIPPVHKDQVPAVLERFDVCYIGLHKRKIFQYGVSPNKLFDYMLAGKPILHSINTGKNLVCEAGCGISVEAENPNAIADAIEQFYNLSEEDRIEMGKRGKKFVIRHHNYKSLAEKYIRILSGELE